MGKFAVNNTFDIEIYEYGKIVYKSDTVKEVIVSRDFDKGENFLRVRDVLLDTTLFNYMVNGAFDGRDALNVKCKTTMRNINNEKDYNCYLDIRLAELVKYEAPFGFDMDTFDMIFKFDSKNVLGESNTSLSYDSMDWDGLESMWNEF